MQDIEKIKKFIKNSNGILKLRPAWIAHDFLTSGKRLGLPDDLYDQGERGQIMERWFCSVTHAENRINIEDEGLSYLEIPGENILVKDAIQQCPEIIGLEYSKSHNGLEYLIKLYDFGCRLFLHFHQEKKYVESQGKNPKDEAYYFLDAPLGPHPETFFGVHPYIVKNNLQYKIFEPLLKEWTGGDAEILKHSRAFYCVPGEGFLLKSGILHAPGSVLTMEIQESSDVGAILQPKVGNYVIDKRMLTKDVSNEDLKKFGPEKAVLRQIDWEACANPDLYKQMHLYPKRCLTSEQNGIYENWIYYGTNKFSGKRLILKPNQVFFNKELGVHNIFVWKGKAEVGGYEVEAGDFNLKYCNDELLICHDRAIEGYMIKNTGNEDLVLFKYFGPDINNDIIPDLG